MTIKKQLLCMIVLLTLIPMLVVPWAGYMYITEIVKDQLLFQSRNQLEEISRDTEDMLEDILMVSNVITSNESVTDVLRNESADIQNQADIVNLLSDINAIYLYRYNATICIYDNYGHTYSTLGEEQDEEAEFRLKWKEETVKNEAFFLWKSFTGLSEENPALGLSRNFYDPNGKQIGVLCIEIYRDRYLDSLLVQESDIEHTERYLVGNQNNFILSYMQDGTEGVFTNTLYREVADTGDRSEPQEVNIRGTEYIVFQKVIKNTDWKVVQVVPYDEVFFSLANYRNLIYISNIICVILIILIDIYMINKISRSLIRLGNAMKQVRHGHFITLDIKEKNIEMQQIYDDFNNMSTRLEYLFEETQRITKEKEGYRLTALQTQIQPHFLFNTLNGIKWLCVIESAPTAERMLESLGYILQESLGKAQDCVPLSEEITCLRHYIELQKMRYGNIFDVEYKIDPQLQNLEVPVLLLQPLVENSIIHGIREMKERGVIIIGAQIEDGEPVLYVEDNGIGIPEGKIGQILEREHPEGSIGMVNVKERIKLYYKESKFEIASEEGKGTKVRLVLGLRRE